jgi:hypothetical protein
MYGIAISHIAIQSPTQKESPTSSKLGAERKHVSEKDFFIFWAKRGLEKHCPGNPITGVSALAAGCHSLPEINAQLGVFNDWPGSWGAWHSKAAAPLV